MRTVNLSFFVFLTSVIHLTYSFSCRTTSWSHRDSDVRCTSSEFELYRETTAQVINRRCCTSRNGVEGSSTSPSETDVEAWEREIARATTCKILPCQNIEAYPRGTDLCSTLPLRILRMPDNRRQRVVYTEGAREHCKLKDGEMGVISVCCPDLLSTVMLTAYQAEPFEFPYIAHVYNSNTTDWCGAAIYNDLHLITASHCVVNKQLGQNVPVEDISVLVGTNIALVERRRQHHGYHEVDQIFSHPEYSGLFSEAKGGDDWECRVNDIAVIRLKKRITFDSHVKPIEIAPPGFDPKKYGFYALSAGWGVLSDYKQLPYLRKNTLKIRDDEVCFGGAENSWQATCDDKTKRGDQYLCLGGLASGEGKSADYPNPVVLSPGFSGGPVVCRGENGKPILCGIVSAGGVYSQCLKDRTPNSCPFIRASEVSYFRDFIVDAANAQVEENNFQMNMFGSKVTSLDEFPHQVYIDSTMPNVRACGGTLIANDTVITAAHCVVTLNPLISAMYTAFPPSKIRVISGAHDLSLPVDPSQVFSLKSVHIYPQFLPLPFTRQFAEVVIKMFFSNKINRSFKFPVENDFFYNDIAILKLKRPVNIPQDKLPLLSNLERAVNHPTSSTATALAFARSNTKDFGKLLKHEVRILGLPDCKERGRLMRNPIFPTNILCMVDRHSGGSVCDREMGGGVIRTTRGEQGPRDVLVGVYNFRPCETSLANTAINVGLESTWIREILRTT